MTPTLHRTQVARAVALAALAMTAAQVQAQSQSASPVAPTAAASAPAASAEESVKELGVVQVTGQSRVQQLQNVPIAMTVVSADSIKTVGATTMADLSGLLPGLTVDASVPTQPEYTMRGLGSSDFGIGTDAPVGIYVDGVYTGKTGGALLTFNDVKRIEVLEGPQGTLFGRNAAAGAISIINNDPSGQLEVNSLVRLGDEGLVHGEFLYNNAINDSTDIRFSYVREHKDGWQYNTFDGKKYGGDNGWGTRLALKWSNETTSAVLSWEHEETDQLPRAVVALPTNAQLTSAPLPINPAAWANPIRSTFANDETDPIEARKYDGVTLRINHDLDFATLTSTTAFRGFHSRNTRDDDGEDVPSATLSAGNLEQNRNWQQEFKLNGSNDTFDWVAGTSAYYENAKQQTPIYSNTETIDNIYSNASGGLLKPFAITNELAAMSGIPGINLLDQDWSESMYNTGVYKAAAAYGDVIWKLSPDTNITGGIRFTHDSKTFSWYNPERTAAGLDAQLATLNSLGFFQAVNANQATIAKGLGLSNAYLQAALTQATGTPNLGNALYGLMTTNINFNSAQATSAPLYSSAAWNNTSPRVVVDHHLDKNTMVYGSVTRGYQAGGFNAIYKSGISTFGPETITNYETGIKGSLPSAGLFYTASLFHYDFSNLQSIGTTTSSSGILTYMVNVSDQQATGADLSSYWQVNKHWRLNASTELINQTYKKYAFSPSSTTTIDMAGQAVGTPRGNATLGVNATYGMFGGNGSGTLNWAYQGAARCNSQTTLQDTCGTFPAFRVGAPTSTFDLRLGWDTADKKWGAAVVVKNLFNQQYVGYVSSVGSSVGSPTAWITPPRSAFFEVSMKM